MYILKLLFHVLNMEAIISYLCKITTQGLLEPDFYGDLVYKLKKIVGSNNFSAKFINRLFVCLFGSLRRINPCGSLASDGIKLNMMKIEKVKIYRIK